MKMWLMECWSCRNPGRVNSRDTTPPPRFEVKTPAGAPNVLIVLVDDMGFGMPSSFGGPVRMPTSEALALLAPLLTDPSIEKIGHDLKADLIVLGRHGVDVQNPKGFDTMIAVTQTF